MVGLGYDLSALEKGAPEAFRLINSQTAGMSAEMKRTAREGAESFRLIDEALGIHVSRPLTRILTQEFPVLASGLQSLLGVGIVGALGAAAFEGIEKLIRGVEHAEQAQENYTKAVQHSEDVVADLGAAHARVMKEIELQLAEQHGEPGAKLKAIEFRIDTSALDEAKKQTAELTKALDEQNKAAIENEKWWNQVGQALGYVARNFFSSSVGADEAAKKFENFQRVLDTIGRGAAADPLSGLRQSLQRVDEEMKTTGAEIIRQITAIQTAESTTINIAGPHGTQRQVHPDSGVDPAVLANNQRYFELLKAQQVALQNIIDEDRGHRQVAAGVSDEAERQLKAEQAIGALYKEMQNSISKLQPETDPIKKLDKEIADFRTTAEENFREVAKSAASALELKAATAALDNYEKKLDRIRAILESDILRSELPSTNLPGGVSTSAATPVSIATTPAQPTLGAGGTTGAQFDAFSNDRVAQLKAAAAAYQDLVTPQQKYELAQQELNLLLKEGLIDQTAFTAALQKANEQLVQGEDHIHKMQEDLQKLLERSTSATAGVQAFFLQLQVDAAQNGKFAFDLLNQGLKGFEDELTKAVFTGKAHWEDLFRSMTESAFKFMLNKDIAGLFQMIGNTGVGKSLGIANLIPGAGGTSGALLNTAATTLQTGSTTLIAAATELQAAATSLAASGAGGGGGISALFDAGIPTFAGGTDDAPGGFSWVGEKGPELLDLPAGSSVTPAASLRSGGDTHQYFIDAKGAEIGVEEKIVRALQQAEPRFIGKAMANFTEVQRRTAGQQR